MSWTLTKNELPPLDMAVIVWRQGWNVAEARLTNDSDYGQGWETADGGFFSVSHITHWQYLPDEPNDEGNIT